MNRLFKTVLAGLLLLTATPSSATKVLGLRVIDNHYLMVHFRDGEVHYRDNGTGPSAYLGHSFSEGDDTLVVFGERLKAEAQNAALWQISSPDDKSFVSTQPLKVWRKSKPMNTDHTLTSECDHWLFLQLPQPMKQGCTYEVSIPKGIGADQEKVSVIFDVWNSQSEAIHVNIIGYSPAETIHAADLYQWLGDGGQRDYSSWEGRKVYIYNVKTKKKQNVGTVKFWKSAADAAQEAGKKALIGTDVWNIDFKATTPGRYRLVVEDVGCSMDFDIASDIYFQPYRYSVRGYYYMRLGEPKDPEHVWPVPRQPQFIPETDPKGLTVYKTDLTPWDKEWRDLHTDVWDEPHFKPVFASIFWQHRLPGNPVNTEVKGGHSDAFDWDRHLAHVSNIYDMLLPYILSGGRLSEDHLGIRESGNGIPDIIDEARNEVDFFLSIRDGEAYSQGVTNPSEDWSVMFQAGCTTMAAWANAANCAIIGEAFRLQGNDSLRQYYTDEAIKAFFFASRQDNLQLVMLAHYIAKDKARKKELEHVMYTEAGWAMGRNPGNIVEMTGLGERHITDCYTTGRNDGAPECHPGQTPFNGTETWSPGHNGGDARVILKYCYPDWNEGGWPRQESFFNQRYFWVNGEFTPSETMRGKMALLGYLYAIR